MITRGRRLPWSRLQILGWCFPTSGNTIAAATTTTTTTTTTTMAARLSSSSSGATAAALPQVVDLEPCDYLVVGAGAMGLAFVDTLLTELLQKQSSSSPSPSCRVVLVDRHPAPGGHWNDDYDFVKLHQPSLVYGVNSQQLEGNWMKCVLGGALPWNHRASKPELLQYYQSVVDGWVAQGALRYYPNANYDFLQAATADGNTRTFTTTSATDDDNSSTTTTYRVAVHEKVVDAVRGECVIPATCPPAFPVDPAITVWTPNQLVASKKSTESSSSSWLGSLFGGSKAPSGSPQKYVVIGCGKTGMDTIVFLQSELRVLPEDIYWVVSRDVWMLNRAKSGPSAYTQALLRANGNHEQAVDDMEQKGHLHRLDPEVRPTASFRFPTISNEELVYIRKIDQKIRRGRVSSISVENGSLCLNFEGTGDPYILDGSSDSVVVVHCACPGPFNGYSPRPIFESDDVLTLTAVFAPPIPLSGATIAWVEAARRKGTLDLDFARRLVGLEGSDNRNHNNSAAPSEDQVLRDLLQSYNPGGDAYHQLVPLRNLAVLLAIGDRDPREAAAWFTKNNRLSIYHWMAKLSTVENLEAMADPNRDMGFSDRERAMFGQLLEKLEPLRGM